MERHTKNALKNETILMLKSIADFLDGIFHGIFHGTGEAMNPACEIVWNVNILGIKFVRRNPLEAILVSVYLLQSN